MSDEAGGAIDAGGLSERDLAMTRKHEPVSDDVSDNVQSVEGYDLEEAANAARDDRLGFVRQAQAEINQLPTVPPDDKAEKEDDVVAEAEEIAESAAVDPILTEAAKDVIHESRKAPVTRLPDKPLPNIDLLPPQVVTLQEAIDKTLDDLGDTADKIKEAMEQATTPEAFASLLPILDAHIRDALLLDEKHQERPGVVELKALMAVALEAFTDPDQKGIKRRKGTGQKVIEVTTTDGGTKEPEVVGKNKPGEAYVSITPDILINSVMLTRFYEIEARALAHARTAAEILASGEEIDIDPDLPSAYEDPLVKALTGYIYDDMIAKLDEAEEILLQNPEWIKEKFGVDDDEQIKDARIKVQKLLAYYNGLYEKIPDYEETPEDYDKEE